MQREEQRIGALCQQTEPELEQQLPEEGEYWSERVSTRQVLWALLRSRRSFWMISSSPQRWYGIQNYWKLKENLFIFSVSTVPADGLAPLGARTSAGTVMTKFGSLEINL